MSAHIMATSEYAVVITHAIAVDADALRSVTAAMREFTEQDVECKVEFDDDSRHVVDIEDLDEGFEIWDTLARAVSLTSHNFQTTPSLTASVRLSGGAVPVTCDVSGPAAEAKQLRDKLRAIFARARPMYSTLARFESTTDIMFAVTLGMGIGVGASGLMLNWAGSEFISGVLSSAGSLPWGAVIFFSAFFIVVFKYWTFLFPRFALLIGAGKRRSKSARWWRNVVLLAFVLSVAASVVATLVS